MRWRDLVILFVVALGALLVASRFVTAPGYMDAEYYFAGGLQIASGEGFQEPFLWNYLDRPTGIPHPSHTYWMPLASLVAAAGMALLGSLRFAAAQLPFLLLGALVPPITAQLSFQLSRNRWFAWIAGLLAVCSGFYLNLLTTTETFALYMVLGGAFLLLAFPDRMDRPAFRFFLLGLAAGLLHLSRADGLIWLAAVGFALGWWAVTGHWQAASVVKTGALALTGYLLVMTPWFLRNLLIFGTLFSPGGSLTLWLTEYNLTYAYPAKILSPATWWQAGLGAHLDARLWALGMNLKNCLGAQTLVVLLPMTLVGAYRLRRRPEVLLFAGMWLLTLLVMTVVFPFAGARGGFLHSGAALQPVIWALAPVGLGVFIDSGVAHRGWIQTQATKVFSVALVVIALLVTLALFWGRVVGPDPTNPVWAENSHRYARVDQALETLGVDREATIMVNNPPGFYLASGRPSIVVPGGDLASVLQAANNFGARVLVLEADQENLAELYGRPISSSGLIYRTSIDGIHLFEFATRQAGGE